MNDEMEKAERLFQQLSGNETTKGDDLSHLKVYIQGDNDRGNEIISYLLNLDSRTRNSDEHNGKYEDEYYFIDITDDRFKITFESDCDIPSDYRLLHIKDILDEEESCDDTCPECGEYITSSNEEMYYNSGDMCCESCYDEDLDNEGDEESIFEHPTPRISDIERAENTFRLLSETQSAPKDVIDSKLSELSNIPRRRRR